MVPTSDRLGTSTLIKVLLEVRADPGRGAEHAILMTRNHIRNPDFRSEERSDREEQEYAYLQSQ